MHDDWVSAHPALAARLLLCSSPATKVEVDQTQILLHGRCSSP